VRRRERAPEGGQEGGDPGGDRGGPAPEGGVRFHAGLFLAGGADLAAELDHEAVAKARRQEPEQPGRHAFTRPHPIAARREPVDQRHDQHVAEKIGDRPRLQPGPREKFAAHEEEVRPGHCQQAHERPADGQGEQPLQERDGHADDGEFSELDEAARHRAVRTVPCIFVGVLELVGDPQQQERAERTQERHDKRQRGRPAPRSNAEYPTAEALNAAINGPCASSGKRSCW
jgi:hypothetical protein